MSAPTALLTFSENYFLIQDEIIFFLRSLISLSQFFSFLISIGLPLYRTNGTIVSRWRVTRCIINPFDAQNLFLASLKFSFVFYLHEVVSFTGFDDKEKWKNFVRGVFGWKFRKKFKMLETCTTFSKMHTLISNNINLMFKLTSKKSALQLRHDF